MPQLPDIHIAWTRFNDSEVRAKAVTIGTFDGVHRGHQSLLSQLREAASRRSLAAAALTFDVPPRAVLEPSHLPQLLTPTPEKLSLLGAEGLDAVGVLSFTRAVASLSARAFLKYLRGQCDVRLLVMGYDHRFGADRLSAAEIARVGAKEGVEVVEAKELAPDAVALAAAVPHVSSSAVRRAVGEGRVADAAALLGRKYSLSGTVGEGRKVGRTLGFPTANLVPSEVLQMVPATGVYACDAEVVFSVAELPAAEAEPHPSQAEYHINKSGYLINKEWAPAQPSGVAAPNQGAGVRTFRAVVNIGTRPTLDNGADTTIEAHLLGFSGSLYGAALTLRFLARLRDEQRFPSLSALQTQIAADAARAAEIPT